MASFGAVLTVYLNASLLTCRHCHHALDWYPPAPLLQHHEESQQTCNIATHLAPVIPVHSADFASEPLRDFVRLGSRVPVFIPYQRLHLLQLQLLHPSSFVCNARAEGALPLQYKALLALLRAISRSAARVTSLIIVMAFFCLDVSVFDSLAPALL